MTIDPVDARDFDDAISLTELENGHWKLGVHIADVAHFVPIGSISTVLSVVASVGSLLSVYALWSIVRSTAALSIANTFVSLRFGFFLVLVATFAFIAVVAKPVLGEWDPDYSKTSY